MIPMRYRISWFIVTVLALAAGIWVGTFPSPESLLGAGGSLVLAGTLVAMTDGRTP